MPLQIPSPHTTFEVVLEDGARIRLRRHGNPEGVRLFLSHGNGYAINGYLPYWQHFLDRFDVIVFDFRNHGENTPAAPANHTYAQLSRDLERVYRDVMAKLGKRKSVGIFHSMSERAATRPPGLSLYGGFRDTVDGIRSDPPHSIRPYRGVSSRLCQIARWPSL